MQNTYKNKSLLKYVKITKSHILVDLIITFIDKMRKSCKKMAKTALKLVKTKAKVTKELYKTQVKLAYITIKKAISELINYYIKKEKLLIQG